MLLKMDRKTPNFHLLSLRHVLDVLLISRDSISRRVGEEIAAGERSPEKEQKRPSGLLLL